MENLKDTVYNLIKNHSGYDFYDLEKILNIESNADFIMLNKVLNQLEDEYLIIRNKDNKYLLFDEEGLFKGKINYFSSGKIVFRDNDNIFEVSDSFGAMDNDEVIVKYLNKAKKVRVVKVINRAIDSFVAGVSVVKNNTIIKPDNWKLKFFKFNINKNIKLKNNYKYLFKIERYPYSNNVIDISILKVIGNKYDPGNDISSLLLENNIRIDFDDVVLKEAKKVNKNIIKTKNRRDLRNEMIFTIDGKDAKDFDDAISIEKINNKYKLGVHISDVSYFIKNNSALDTEARLRGFSCYVVDRVVPMLPFELSDGICSLMPNVDRYCISVEMLIDNKGRVTDFDIFESIINSKYRLTYEDVNKLFNNDEIIINKYSDIVDTLLDMKECSKLIRKIREDNGAIDFNSDEALIKVNKKGIPVSISKRERNDSEKMIEDFMILANSCVASFVRNLNIPSIYRVHESIKKEKIDEFMMISKIIGLPFKTKSKDVKSKDISLYLKKYSDDKLYPIISTILLRSMNKARYDKNPIGHFGLSLSDYLHFTSPIRRYPDLIVHRMIRKYIFENNFYDYDNDELLMGTISNEASLSEKRIINAERDVNDMKMAEYMSYHIGESYYGNISTISEKGFYVRLDNLIEGFVRFDSFKDNIYQKDSMSIIDDNKNVIYTLGDFVRIIVVNANKYNRMIDFIIYDEEFYYE